MVHCFADAMPLLSRVVWFDGMHLGPQHFQLQARYFEDATTFATAALWRLSYGLAGCRLDPEALENGALSVLHARGTFPDGLVFDMPDADALPPTRKLSAGNAANRPGAMAGDDVGDAAPATFPATRESVTVLLAIPERRANNEDFAAPERPVSSARFIADTRALVDENTGVDERRVLLGRKNIRLLLDAEPAEGMVTLPIARVTRDRSGKLIYDPAFIPPCVQISASEFLMMLLRRLLDILDEKSVTMSQSAQSSSLVEFSSRDIAAFWYLHAINSAAAPLRHIWSAKRGHPEELYLEMARLAGALCTFALESSLLDIPAYDHLNLDRTFRDLDRFIRRHLDLILPTNCISIPLVPGEPGIYHAEIADRRAFGRSRWMLGMRSSAPDLGVIAKAPALVKVCSRRFVTKLVRHAMPGAPLTFVESRPAACPSKVDYHYFSISKTGPSWDDLAATGSIGVYIPAEFPQCELELLIALES